MQQDANADVVRQQRIVAFRARFAVVKGYTQLLNRQAARTDIPREQLAQYCSTLQAQLELLEGLAQQLLYSQPTDELLNESVPRARHDAGKDGDGFS